MGGCTCRCAGSGDLSGLTGYLRVALGRTHHDFPGHSLQRSKRTSRLNLHRSLTEKTSSVDKHHAR